MCKVWAYTKYYFFRLNRKYDDMKEPYRFLTLLAIVSPWVFLLKYDKPITGLVYLLVLVILRAIWHGWANFKMKDK